MRLTWSVFVVPRSMSGDALKLSITTTELQAGTHMSWAASSSSS